MAGKTARPQATQERTLTPMLTQCPECGHRMWWDSVLSHMKNTIKLEVAEDF